jgi:hypothetical protein
LLLCRRRDTPGLNEGVSLRMILTPFVRLTS